TPAFSEETTPLPPGLVTEIGTMAGVGHVRSARRLKVRYDGSLPTLMAVDSSAALPLALVQGDPAAVGASLARGEGVIVDEAFASDFHVGVGDAVILPSAAGELRL